jgi:hypothetical protein
VSPVEDIAEVNSILRSKVTGARTPANVEIATALRRIGSLIRRQRIRDCITLAELADRCIVSIPTMRKAERGDPTVRSGVIAAAFLQLGLGEIVLNCVLSKGDGERDRARQSESHASDGM